MSYRAQERGVWPRPLRRGLGLLVVVLALCPVSTLAQTGSVQREVTASAEPCLDLHSEPDSMSPVARCLPTGSRMNLLESRDGWARVRLGTGEEGWVEFRLVRPAMVSEPVQVAPQRTESVAAERRQIARLESALAAAAVERNELQRGTSALRGEIYELRLANEALMAAAAEREAAEAEAARKAAELESALAAASSEAEAAASEAARLRETLADLESRDAERESLLEDATARLEAAEQLLAEAESRRLESIEELEVLWREETALRERAQDEQARLASENAALRAEAEELRRASERLAEETLAVEAGRAEAERRIEELASALARAEAARAELEANQEDPESGGRIALLEQALGMAEAERLGLEREQVELRQELERLADRNEWLAMAAVEQPSVVSVAAAAPREYEGASQPGGSGTAVAELISGPVEPEPEPEPSEASVLELEDPTAVVQAWARAWSEQRVEDYLSFYARDFVPADSSSREEWKALRRTRVAGPEWIDVRVALADLQPLEDDRIAVVFLQSYESDLMTDVVLKTLEMVREDGVWKIAAERVE